MATIGNTYVDLIDILKATEDGKTIAPVIELLRKQNPILLDAVTVECNMGTKHRHSVRTGLPSVTWGKLYQGIPQSKASRQQVDDTTGFVEALSSVDRRILDLKPGLANQYRLSEGAAYIEALNQDVASGIFYNDSATTPEKFKGLAARYNALSGATYGNNVVGGGGVGSDNTSIWFVTHGAGYTTLLRPEGVPGGIQREDKGEQRVTDSDNNPYYVMEELYRWHIGVSVEDWRYNVRIANIDVSNVAAGSVDLYDLLDQGYWKLQSTIERVAGDGADGTNEPVNQVIYMNRQMMQGLGTLARNSGASDNFVRLTPMEVEGKVVQTYRGIPIRLTDSLLNTETVVS